MRFIVKQLSNVAWTIIDTQAAEWSMSERAVSLNFGSDRAASEVATILNQEWGAFQRNPQ